jgi:hypothetical protein
MSVLVLLSAYSGRKRTHGETAGSEVANPRQIPLIAFLRFQRAGYESPFQTAYRVSFTSATLSSFSPSGFYAVQGSATVSGALLPCHFAFTQKREHMSVRVYAKKR